MSQRRAIRTTRITVLALAALIAGALTVAVSPDAPASAVDPLPDGTPFSWGAAVAVDDQANFTDAGQDAIDRYPGKYGSEFPRATHLADGSWIIGITYYDNNGYTHDAAGGTRLRFKRSTDNGRTWSLVSSLAESGRDLDNAQIVQRSDGALVVAYRSVRWQESYRVLTRVSTNGGASWGAPATVDANEGTPGSLGNPDRGVYEPFMNIFSNGDIGVLYANEKYATATPAYSQVISERISTSGGTSWGAETFAVRDTTNSASRPGMPVWTKLSDGTYGFVFELCGTDGCNAHYMASSDGRSWPAGVGTKISNQTGAPYLLALSDGRLVVTSNTNEISISRDLGATWYLDDTHPWGSLADANNYWPQLVQTGPNEIAAIVSAGRAPLPNGTGDHLDGGHDVKVKFGTFAALSQPAISDGDAYTFTAQHSGLNLDVASGSMADGATVQQWTPNGLAPQNWVVHKQSDGAYLLQNQQSSKVLDVDADSLADGARVQQWAITGCTCQHWFLDYIGSGIYQVREAHSNKNLDITAGSTTAGATAEQWPNNSQRAQRWRLSLVQLPVTDGGTYTFTAGNSALNLDVAGGSTSNGATVQQWTPNGLAPQNWTLHRQSDGSYIIQNQQSGKLLEVASNSMANGARVQQWDNTGCACQHWFIEYTGGGYYRVRAAHSNQNLDVTGASTTAGTAIEQWPENGASAQRWKLTVVP